MVSETELDPPSGPPQRLFILGAAAAVLVSVAVGVGVAVMAGGGDDQTAEVPKKSAAPPAPGTFALGTPEETGTSDATTGAPSANPSEALKMAGRLERSGEESAAIEVLDDFLRSEGDVTAVVEARNDLFARCDELLQSEADKIRKLRRLGQDDLIAEKLERLRKRLPTALHPELDMLGSVEVEVAAADPAAAAPPMPVAPTKDQLDAEESNPNLATYNRLARNLEAQKNPEAQFKLGNWAKENGLYKRANQCFERAIALDGFHEGARKALGHGFHEGRWYEPDAYRRDVLGLVKDAKGKWVKPEALAAKTRVKKDPVVKPKVKKALVPPPPPLDTKEDTAWYSDNEAICSFEDAPEYKSKYYLIKTNVKPEYAERYGKMMDQYFKRFVKVFKAFLPNKRYEKSEIHIYATKKEFQDSNPRMPKTAGGFYNTQTKRVTGYHGLFGPTGNTRTVLVHEGTHQFEDLVLQGKFRNAPIWIIEGLAVFFESAYYDNGEIRIGLIPRDRLYALKRGVASNSLIPLSQLIRTPQARFGGYHYAHAWSLIYMVLYYGESPKIRKRCQKWFSDLFAAALTKQVTPRDVEEGVGGKAEFKELEARWKAWIKDLPYDYDPKKN